MHRRKTLFTLVLMIGFSFTIAGQADIVSETYFLDDPFFSGIAGTNPGNQESDFNLFDSSPNFTGEVGVENPEGIFAGNGNLVFSAQSFSPLGSSTRVEFDMGAGLADSTLNEAELVGSSIQFRGIDLDGDIDPFRFRFNATLLSGTQVTNLSQLNIVSNGGLVAISDLDAGTFELELSGDTATINLEFSSTNNDYLRSVNFSQISPDVSGDVLTMIGNRTINFTPVPEPTSAIILGGLGLWAVSHRRRRIRSA
ncbi:MAG: PEP-CTERM sorting domain-containing protein [Planctomycetota bacterium]